MLHDRLSYVLPALLLGGVTVAVIASRADAGPVASNLLAQPDLIVGDIQDVLKHGTSGGISAYSFGTTSCNVGDKVLTWNANTNNHPVIGSNVYRLKDGVLEQLGMSWLKHGFSTLNQNLCATCQPTNGTTLGIGCSDPYSASLNGSQSNLGPRTDVNAYTGFFPYPPTLNPAAGVLGGRLQLPNGDIDPTLNTGARYFVESQYVHPEDSALIGNGLNNVAYREIRFNSGSAPWTITFVTPTTREATMMDGWKALDPTVQVAEFQLPNDGWFQLASKVIQLSPTSWKYVYVLYNRDSDRGARAFGVPVSTAANVSARTFRDVAYHSNETVLGTDWTPMDGPAAGLPRLLGWLTGSWNSNPNNNGIRWGTAYTMTFTVDRAPTTGQAKVLGFKNGSPAFVNVTTQIPQ